MRGSIRSLLLGVLAVTVLRHLGGWPFAELPIRTGGIGWCALSFALAAVVDIDRTA